MMTFVRYIGLCHALRIVLAGWMTFFVPTLPAVGGDRSDSHATASSNEALSTEELRELQAKLNQRRELTVRFTQMRTSSLRPKKPTVSRGIAAFTRATKFRWEFEKPSPDVLIFDGRHLFSYKPGEKTATRFSANAERAREIKEVIDFVLDFDALLNRYSIKQAVRAKEEINLTLQPKAKSAISELVIRVDNRLQFVSGVKMTFQNRNVSEFLFSEPKFNVIGPDMFNLPKGVQVVDGV